MLKASRPATLFISDPADYDGGELVIVWVQSLVRSDTQRAMLFDMDTAIQGPSATQADDAARGSLVGIYHNLLRAWIESLQTTTTASSAGSRP